MNMYEECCSNRPDHLMRFPCMSPWIGNRYQDGHHKRLLVMGESFYLPEGSTIHREPRTWYGSRQEELTGQERAWIHTDGCIIGEWKRAHRIYRSIQDEITGILKENNVPLDEKFPLNHVAYETVLTNSRERFSADTLFRSTIRTWRLLISDAVRAEVEPGLRDLPRAMDAAAVGRHHGLGFPEA